MHHHDSMPRRRLLAALATVPFTPLATGTGLGRTATPRTGASPMQAGALPADYPRQPDERVSAVVGTHTHVPTADAHILEHGTAYQTDLGMCGDYDSVIGIRKDLSLTRFQTRMRGPRMEAADGQASICGLFVETDDATGLARHVAPIRLGGRLAETVPEATTPAIA